jgi:hypothetical protein
VEAKSCPMCKGSVILAGSAMAGFATPLSFVPHGMRPSLSEQGVPMTWVACLSCGHTWLQVAPQDLRACIASRGTELLKQRLARLDRGPHHDLPDLAGAIQADEWVAEIDELIMAGKQVEATRRYHELSGKTWDETLETMREWRDLKLAGKLSLFLQPAQEKPAPGAKDVADHPMADRWLDQTELARSRARKV